MCKGGCRPKGDWGIVLKNSVDRKNNKELTEYARNLRNNMTKEEKHLWYDFLRSYPERFLRQKIFGRYIVDFYCSAAQLVIELDGSQHFEDKGMAYDKERTEYLEEYGLKVVRIPNNIINENFEEVCLYIDNIVKDRIEGRLR